MSRRPAPPSPPVIEPPVALITVPPARSWTPAPPSPPPARTLFPPWPPVRVPLFWTVPPPVSTTAAAAPPAPLLWDSPPPAPPVMAPPACTVTSADE